MTGLFQRLKKFLGPRKPLPLTEAEMADLKAMFKARYHDFRQLLTANSRALETMAEMESVMTGDTVFGMAFIRSRCTRMATNVYKMIKFLDALAPDKYGELYNRFKTIKKEIDISLRRGPTPKEGSLILPLKSLDRDAMDEVGAKMANLGEVGNRVGQRTPLGFAITASSYRAFFRHNGLQEEIDRRIQTSQPHTTDQLFEISTSLQQLVIEAEIPHELRKAINDAYLQLEEEAGEKVRVALRSSGLGEDTVQTSFAGQYLSQLNVPPEGILDAYKEVVASKYSPQAMHYRFQRGLRDADLAMAVGCLAMVDAVSGGVAYTANPLDIRDSNVQITAAFGLPKGVVEGDMPIDLYIVSRGDPMEVLERRLDRKTVQYLSNGPEGGVVRRDIDDDKALQPALTDERATALVRMALELERHYGSPRDLEWALDPDGHLYILQCRPLTQFENVRAGIPARKHQGRALVGGGMAASTGVACGPVRWVRSGKDAREFPRGSVLALKRPEPRWAALLGKAVAVVAEEGTMEGHLATVAREYGIPALFHLGKAAEVLEDGQEVTVDADGLAVYPGRDEALLAKARKRSNLMADSQVFRTMEDVLKHITPLTLIGPESPDFVPSRCRSLHDITRYCHEKSVREMFDFGKRHRFPERSAKQLYYKVPMQYWVIDLDDGFREPVDGKYVDMDNIACRPMRALSAGFAAVPWDGPPALSGKGFASIMFEATTNPELGVHLKSPVADKTYFMISRHYMTVQSRLGFHFTTVEAFVGDRDKENYVSFSFSGGAADKKRRDSRARFIGEILEHREFMVVLSGDTLRARIEGRDESTMLHKLRILGYMVMHTRQLDMIMNKPKMVGHYRSKIRRDLDSL